MRIISVQNSVAVRSACVGLIIGLVNGCSDDTSVAPSNAPDAGEPSSTVKPSATGSMTAKPKGSTTSSSLPSSGSQGSAASASVADAGIPLPEKLDSSAPVNVVDAALPAPTTDGGIEPSTTATATVQGQPSITSTVLSSAVSATPSATVSATPSATVSATATATPVALCGDGTVTAPEECDDGATLNMDGCNSSCKAERILDIGHIDLFSVVYNQQTSELRLQVKETSELYRIGPTYWEPEDVIIDVSTEKTALQVPDDRFLFLGPIGQTVYILPEDGSFQTELPWPGWETYRLLDSLPSTLEPAATPDPVEVEVQFTGPGEVFSFFSPQDELSPPTNRYVDSSDALPDIIPMGVGTHTHTNWVFTAEGNYTMTATPRLHTKNSGVIAGRPRTFRFHVGAPLLPAEAAPTVSLQGGSTWDSTAQAYLPTFATGQSVALKLSANPTTSSPYVDWYLDRTEEQGGPLLLPEHSLHLTVTASTASLSYQAALISQKTTRILSRAKAYVAAPAAQ